MNENTILQTVPAARELHKVPGFDPTKYLRRTVNGEGEPVMGLELRYQRLWFRLACPNGRMLLNPLRITDQLAIFEAKVFFHRDDADPASSFTADKTVNETPNYIRAAQDEALKAALDNAGFSIQLYDVTEPDKESGDLPSIQPGGGEQLQPAPAEPAPESDPKPALPPQTAPAPEPAPAHAAEKPAEAQAPSDPAPEAPAQAAEKPAEAQAPSDPAPEAPAAGRTEPPVTPENTAKEVEHRNAPEDGIAPRGSQTPSPETVLNFPANKPAGGAPSQASSKYTNDMTAEEICQVMTLEEAREVIVTKGACAGWTMGKVADRRPSSLKFYLSGFGQCDNIQFAAAKLLNQELEMKKAG